MLIEFNNLETLIFALVVLFIGEIITNRYTILQRYNIPTPVTGGLIFSIIFSLLRVFADIEIQFAIEFIGPLSLILIVQVFVTLAFVYFIVFRVIGKRYTSSVISSGVVGFGLGSTQTAVANMGAVARHYGPAPTAFLVVPLIGAFFIDIGNAIVIQAFLYLPVFPALG